MAKEPVKKVASDEDPLTDTAEIRRETSNFLEKYKNILIGLGAVIVLAVAGFFAYTYLYLQPKEDKAATAIATAQQWFGMDSLNLTLNGDGQREGVLKIAKKYSGTKAANLAHYYAGMSYLRMGKSEEAIAQLKDFDGKGTFVGNLANGAIGDAYWDKKDEGKALEYYNKAIDGKTKDGYTTPLYLFRSAVILSNTGKNDEAIANLKRIKLEYPGSAQARDVDRYLARLGFTELL